MQRCKRILLLVLTIILFSSCLGCDDNKTDITVTVYKAGENGKIKIDGNLASEVKSDYSENILYTVYAMADEGYEFAAWSDGVTDANRYLILVPGEEEVTAYFKLKEHSVTYAVQYGGGGFISGRSIQKIRHGENAESITAVNLPGYKFIGWSDGIKTAERHDKNVGKDIEVYAIFVNGEYSMTYVAGDGGALSVSKSTTLVKRTSFSGYIHESLPVIEAIPEDGYEFVKWENAKDKIDVAIRVFDTILGFDLEIQAVFEKIEYSINYEANPGGTIEGEKRQKISYNEDAQIVKAIPNDGYEFLGWSDGSKSDIRQDMSIKSNIYVRANFAPEGQLTYKLLMPFVTEVHGEFENKSGGITQVDYEMSALEREILEQIPDRIEGYLNDALKGRIKFVADGYFTEKSLGREHMHWSQKNPIGYSIEAANIPELKEILKQYHGSLTTFCLNDYGRGYELVSIYSAKQGSGFISFEKLLGAIGGLNTNLQIDWWRVAKLLDRTLPCSQRHWRAIMEELYLQLFPKIVESNSGQFSRVSSMYIAEHGKIVNEEWAEIVKPFLANELIIGGELCGIPYNHWVELVQNVG